MGSYQRLHSATSIDIDGTQYDLEPFPDWISSERKSAPSSPACELARQDLRRRYVRHPNLVEIADGCVMLEDRGEFGGRIEYFSTQGDACVLDGYVNPLSLLEWNQTQWVADRLAHGVVSSSLRELRRDGDFVKEGRVISLGDWMAAFRIEDNGDLLVLLEKGHLQQPYGEQCFDFPLYTLVRIRPDLTMVEVGERGLKL